MRRARWSARCARKRRASQQPPASPPSIKLIIIALTPPPAWGGVRWRGSARPLPAVIVRAAWRLGGARSVLRARRGRHLRRWTCSLRLIERPRARWAARPPPESCGRRRYSRRTSASAIARRRTFSVIVTMCCWMRRSQRLPARVTAPALMSPYSARRGRFRLFLLSLAGRTRIVPCLRLRPLLLPPPPPSSPSVPQQQRPPLSAVSRAFQCSWRPPLRQRVCCRI